METCPFSPWLSRNELTAGQLAEFDQRQASPLDDLWLSGFADLYRAFARIMSPAEVDECELWQLAVLLGIERPEDDLDSLAARVDAEKESLRQRAEQAGRISEPAAEPPVGPVDVTADIMRSMGIATK